MDRSYDVLPENQLVRSLRQAGRLGQELKARQRLSSVGGQLNYLVETDDTWDLIEAVTYNPMNPFIQLRITYTGDGTQKFPAVQPYIDLRINGTADSNKVRYLNEPPFSGALGWVDEGVTTGATLAGGLRPDPAYFEDEDVQRWTLLIQTYGDITCYAKVQAMASCDGTVEIERL